MLKDKLLRDKLGDFSSIVCFKAAIAGMEEAIGEKAAAIALTAAGRSRGRNLATELGLSNSSLSLDDIAYKMNTALGEYGTRLCIIEKIISEGDLIKVHALETLGSSGEPEGSPRKCTYTLGAVWGALEKVLDKRLRGKHTESVLRGAKSDVFEFTYIY